MIRFGLVAVVIMVGATGMARAEGNAGLALSLGDLIGSEQPCGMTFSQTAIASFLAANVAADDMDFLGVMNAAANLMPRKFERFTESQRTAHCVQMRRVAQSYGFISG